MFNQCCNNNSSNWNQSQFNNDMGQFSNSCGCQNGCQNGCPTPNVLVAPRRICVTNQVTPVPQKVICPIECRRVNHCMSYPVFVPQYENTFMTMPFMNSSM